MASALSFSADIGHPLKQLLGTPAWASHVQDASDVAWRLLFDGADGSDDLRFLSQECQQQEPLSRSQKTRALTLIARLLVHPGMTFNILRLFRKLILDLVARIVCHTSTVFGLPSSSSATESTPAAAKRTKRKKNAEGGTISRFVPNSQKKAHKSAVGGSSSSAHSALQLHELICLAFSRLLRLAPLIAPLVHTYFASNPTPFDRLSIAPDTLTPDQALQIAQTLFRLMSDQRFAKVYQSQWNWQCFYQLLHFGNDSADDKAALVRAYAAETAAIVLCMSDKDRGALVKRSVTDGGKLQLAHQQHLLLRLQEEEPVVAEQHAMFANSDLESTTSQVVDATLLSQEIADVCGVLMVRQSGAKIRETRAAKSAAEPLVPTATTHANLRSVALALSLRSPVLLEGVTGSGKSSLIDEVARMLGREHDVVKIHLGDQTDGKVLLGTYVCTSKPGVFEWQAGVLTMAVTEGKWVVFEDIDMAPMEVVSILIPLLETRRLFVASRGETIEASPDFQLFATNAFDPFTNSRHTSRSNGLGDSLWTKVEIHPLSHEELQQVLVTRFPRLQQLVPLLLGTFAIVADFYHRPTTRSAYSSGGRYMSTRDIVKWCSRIDAWAATTRSLNYAAVTRDESVLDVVLKEALDCFVAVIPSRDVRDTVFTKLADCLGLSASKAKFLLEQYAPSIDATSGKAITVGRASLAVLNEARLSAGRSASRPFAHTMHSRRLLESICVAVQMVEPVLLVGETGCGKTTVVQHLADLLNQKLVVVNLSQQTESSDLIGGFKPVDIKSVATGVRDLFFAVFEKTFSVRKNQKFLDLVRKAYNKSRWDALVILFRQAAKMFTDKSKAAAAAAAAADSVTESSANGGKRSRERGYDAALQDQWRAFISSSEQFEQQYQQSKNKFLFSFVEGTLVKAVQDGHWILLDEVNLASSETLESLSGLLQGADGSLLLTERGDAEPIVRHPNFRVFACMNPATDVGKRDLPIGLRNRFTELYVDSPDWNRDDLTSIVRCYLDDYSHGDLAAVEDVVNFYLAAKQAAATQLYDGAKTRPHYSLRTLSRALTYMAGVVQVYGLRRSLYEGFYMTYATMLDAESHAILVDLINVHLLRTVKQPARYVQQVPKPPADADAFVQFHAFWLQKGDQVPHAVPPYVVTPSVQRNLNNIARAVVTGRFPVLIQGPTSSGKTSMVEYLAKSTNHKFVRINNHEHTDIQEYLGTYVSSDTGNLVFQEGILVEALRKGYWIVLDELNLAPTDVLEALNRLLDDNRELLIPETQEVVKPHPHFMLFATQNPPGLYGGRKTLSRAFRNRFLELHFDEIPEAELETILSQRCAIAPSYCKKMTEVYRRLQQVRQQSKIFDGKEGYITLRDLFRWANRGADSYQELAENGYAILAERIRIPGERTVVKQALESVMRVQIDEARLYDVEQLELYRNLCADPSGSSFVWTKAMKRLFALVSRCIKYNEPVLLVGDTGCGKTTVCQMLATALGQTLTIVNCHQNSETSDFLGGQRPVRRNPTTEDALSASLRAFLQEHAPEHAALSGVSFLDALIEAFDETVRTHAALSDTAAVQELQSSVAQIRQLFSWHDGPLVQALKTGQLFLLDEISLGEDSVLERLNSVLEPQRQIVLAEKGGTDAEHITAAEGFQFFATMNPGGDYGKKELSPALRNRFTEIWVPQVTDEEDVLQILRQRLDDAALQPLASGMLQFVQSFAREMRLINMSAVISMRDLLSWADFITATHTSVTASLAFIHGGLMLFIDGLGTNSQSGFFQSSTGAAFKRTCVQQLVSLAGVSESEWLDLQSELARIQHDEQHLMIPPFAIETGPLGACSDTQSYALTAPTTIDNMLRVLRAMQLRRSILLEGSPGVGKTSLVIALARLSGHDLVRINLSEQTDLMDLFGADLPVEGGQGGEFAWRDGPFLQAMQSGSWVLLDELNLASQSVLEGLNACLDHRGEVYIPELDKVFACSTKFRVFAAQNPLNQGGGRKGLPKSFLNRFTQVYVDALSEQDMLCIAEQAHPQVDTPTLTAMLAFNTRLHHDVSVKSLFGHSGSPWEFNLRDILRWLQLMTEHVPAHTVLDPTAFLDMMYVQRFRSTVDRDQTLALYAEQTSIAQSELRTYCSSPQLLLSADHLHIGRAVLARRSSFSPTTFTQPLSVLRTLLRPLAAVSKCVEMGWLAILVGPSASSKTSLVRLLSTLCGCALREFSMNSAVDTLELLGGFEQFSLVRHWYAIARDAEEVAIQAAQFAALTGSAAMDQLSSALSSLRASLRLLNGPSGQVADVVAAITALLTTIQSITGVAAHVLSAAAHIRERVSSLCATDTSSMSGKFEWVDGVLIEALEKGQWLLLDNVNFCAPSVIDRLNSLMEPNGSLMLNEQGLVNGKYRVVRPHPNFRLFMTMDPKFGEISRAMRNRGLEIYLTDAAYMTCNEDLAQLCNALGVPGTALPDQLVSYHRSLVSQHGHSISTRSLLHCAAILADLVQRGTPWLEAFAMAKHSAYPLLDSGAMEVDDLARDNTASVWPVTTSTSLLVQDALLVSNAQILTVYEQLCGADEQEHLANAALQYALEILSPADVEFWQALLSLSTTSQATQRLFDVLRDVYRTPSARKLIEAGNSVFALIQTHTKLPLDVTRFVPTLRYIIRGCLTTADSRPMSQHLTKLRTLSALLRLQKECCLLERDMQRVFALAKSLKRSQLSTAQQMYCAHHQSRKFSRHDLPHQILWPLQPVVAQFPIAIASWINSALEADGVVDVDIVAQLLQEVMLLWQSLQSDQADFGRIFILVERIVDQVHSAALLSQLQPLAGQPLATLSQMVKSVTRPFRVIWQRAHPTTLCSLDLWEVLEAVRTRLDRLVAPKYSQSELITQTLAMRSKQLGSAQVLMLAEGVATLYACDTALVDLGDAQKSVISRLPTIVPAPLPEPSDLQDLGISVSQQQQTVAALADIHKMALTEYALQVAELDLLTTASVAVANPTMVAKVKRQAFDFLREVSSTYRYPLELLGYQQLLWLHSKESMQQDMTRIWHSLERLWARRNWDGIAAQLQAVSFAATEDRAHALQRGPRMLYTAHVHRWLSSVLCPLSSVAIMALPYWQDACSFAESALAKMNVPAQRSQADLARLLSKIGLLRESLLSLMPGHEHTDIVDYLRNTFGKDQVALAWSELQDTVRVAQTSHHDEHAIRFAIGKAYLLLGWLFVQIYVPEVAIDPAGDTMVAHEHRANQVACQEASLAVRAVFNKLNTGDTEEEVALDEQLRLAQYRAERAHLARLLPLRSTSATVNAFFNDLHTLKRTIFDTKLVGQAFCKLPESLPLHPAAVALVQETLALAADQLPQRFPLYADVFEPVLAAVEDVRHGLELLELSREPKNSSVRLAVELCFAPSTFSYQAHREVLSSADTSLWRSRPELYVQFLRVCLMSLCVDQTATSRLYPDMAQWSGDLFGRLLLVWQAQEEDRLRKEAEEAQTFKYKTQTHVILDEPSEAEDTARYFPTYSDDYADLTVDPDEPLEGRPDAPLASQETPGKDTFGKALIADDIAILVMRCHRQLFCPWGDSADLLEPTSLLQEQHAFATRLLQELDTHLPESFDYAMRSRYLLLLQSRLQRSSAMQQTSRYNFYCDPHVQQAGKAVPILERFSKRLTELLSRWPDHAILQHLQEICVRIANFGLQSPVMRFLTGFELLVEKADAWERYASSEVSLRAEIAAVSQQVIAWRRFELANWSSILDAQHSSMDASLARLWFHLCGIVQQEQQQQQQQHGPGAQAEEQLHYAPLLEEFMQSATLGDLAQRLNMLQAFYHQLQTCASPLSSRARRLASTLYSVHAHYAQFQSAVQQKVSERRAPIDKELKDYIKLASWKDVNVFALKQSAAKTHRYLNKCIKKYKEVLSKPATDVYHQHQQQLLTPKSGGKAQEELEGYQSVAVPVPEMVSTSASLMADQLRLIEHLPDVERLKRIPTIHTRLHKLLSEALAQQGTFDATTDALDDLSQQMMAEMVAFQAPLPPAEAKAQKSLQKQLRKRALVELLRKLKHLGLSHRVSKMQTQQQTTADTDAAVQSDQQTFDDPTLVPPSLQSAWASASSYFYKLNVMLPALRASLGEHSSDITALEAERLLGYTEHLFLLLRRQRAQLVETGYDLERVHRFTAAVQKQLPLDGSDVQWGLRSSVVVHTYLAITSVLTEVQKVESALRSHESTSAAEAQSLLSQAAADMSSVRQRLQQLAALQAPIHDPTWQARTPGAVSAIEDALRQVQQCHSSLDTLLEDRPALQPVFFLLQQLLQDAARAMQQQQLQTAGFSSYSTPAILATINTMVESAMIATQDVHAEQLQQSQPADAKDADHLLESCLTRQHTELLAVNRKDKPTPLAVQCRLLVDQLEDCCPATGEEQRVLATILQQLGALLAQKLTCSVAFTDKFVAFHRLLSKLAYVLCQVAFNLFKRGFCLPPDEDDEQDGDGAGGNLEENVDGTGIGEGKGEKDVSNEIEDEEQVLGLADAEEQTNEEDQQDGDEKPDQNDEGLQMQNDFEADLEDLNLENREEGDDQDNNNDDDEDSQDDIDDAMDQVDGEDAENKVDESLWNDEENEEDQQARNAELQDEKVSREDHSDQIGQEQQQQDQPASEQNDMGHQEEQEEAGNDGENKPEEDDAAQQQQEELMPADVDGMDMDKDEEGGDEEDAVNDTGMPDEDDDDGASRAGDAEDEDGVNDANDKADKAKEPQDTDAQSDQDQEPEAFASNELDKADDVSEKSEAETAEEDEEPAPQPVTADGDSQDNKQDASDDDDDEEQKQTPPQAERSDKVDNDAAATDEPLGDGNMDLDDLPDQEERAVAGMSEEQAGSDAAKEATSAMHDQTDEAAAARPQQNQQQGSDGQHTEQQRRQQQQFELPNPNRQLGEALQRWQQRLEMLENPEAGRHQEQARDEQDNQEVQPPEGVFEYIEDEDAAHDTQALGAADEHQVQQPQQQDDQDVAEQDEAEQAMETVADNKQAPDVQDSDAMEVDGQDTEPATEQDLDQQRRDIMDQALQRNKDTREQPNASTSGSAQPQQDQDANGTSMETDEHQEHSKPEEEDAPAQQEEEELRAYTPEEVQHMRTELEQSLAKWRASGQDRALAMQLWSKYRQLTQPLAMQLCEQLRLILDPTLAAKLTGDFRTGKRLNMKKIIPYIASDFKKDKIWLRRTRPSKRSYQVLVAVDDSKSMGSNVHTVQLAYEAVAVVSHALAQLEVGQVAVASFGETVRLVHSFDQAWHDSESGSAVVSQFTFAQDKTDVSELVRAALGVFDGARNSSGSGARDLWQLMLVISDGVCDDHERLRNMVRTAATEKRVMVVFIVLDTRSEKDSIVNMTNVVFKPSTQPGGKMSLQMQRYMDTFPFDFYVVLRDIQGLPTVLSDALRQFFSVALA